MPLKICPSESAVKTCLPKGFSHIDIASLTHRTNLTGKYVLAKIETKYNLHTYQISSIKFILKNSQRRINLNAFGDIARDLDICAVGDFLVLTNFSVDLCPKNKTANGLYQIILDDQQSVKPAVWVIKSSRDDNASRSPSPQKGATTSPNPRTSQQIRASMSRSPILALNRVPSQQVRASTLQARALMSNSPISSSKLDTTSIPATSIIDTNQNQGCIPRYTYTPLNDVQIRTTAHVYGVVSYVKDSAKSSGSDYYMMMNIVDPSLPNLDEKLTCNLFHAEKEKLPIKALEGDVIRFHRLKIQSYHGKKQARGGPGFHWVLFQGCYDTREASSVNYTLEDADKKKVNDLLKWWEDMIPLFSQNTLLAIDDGSEYLSVPSTPPGPSTSGLSSRDSSSSKSLKLSPMKVPPIVYQSLKDTREDTVVSFYAVVVFARPLVSTLRKEYHLMLNITDPSLENKDAKVTCNLFDVDKDKLPHMAVRGDVIRFHHIKIQFFRGKKQVVKGNNLQWVLFQQSFDQRVTCSPGCVVKDNEKNKVDSLLDWWQEGPETTPFSNVASKQYFCLVCQIIAVCLIEEKNYRLLRVWDGTKFDGPITRVEIAGIEQDDALVKAAGNLTHDVFVFDNHISSTEGFKPGDFIRLNNLHAAVVLGKVEMTLHGGTAYQRGAKLLCDNDVSVKKLKSMLDPLVSESTGQTPKRQDGNKDGSRPVTHKSGGNTNDGASTSRKLPFDEPSEFESKKKKKKMAKEPEVGSDNVNDGQHLLESRNDNNKNNIGCNEGNVVVISDKSDTTSTQDSNGNNTFYFTDSLSQLSLPSPPNSLNLSERDRFMIQAYLDREQRKEIGDSAMGIATDSVVSEDRRSTRNENSSCISSNCSQGVWLSLYNSSTEGEKTANESRFFPAQEIRKVIELDEERQRLQQLGESSEADSEEKRQQALNFLKSAIEETNSDNKDRRRSARVKAKNKQNTQSLCGICDSVVVSSQSSLGLSSVSHANEGTSHRREGTSHSVDRMSLIEKGVSHTNADSSQRLRNRSDRGTTSLPPSKQYATISLNPLRKPGSIASNTREADEIASSQDSFHTAATHLTTPIIQNATPNCTSQASSIDSPRKYLSLRSPLGKSINGPTTSCSVSSCNSVTQISNVTNRDSVTIIESEDVVSSSVESSNRSLPRDRQSTEGNEEEITSSTDSKESQRAENERMDTVPAGDGEITVTRVSSQNQSRRCFKLEKFLTCKRNTKCKVRVRLRDYFPLTRNVADLVKFCCFTCKYIVASSDVRYKRVVKCPNGCGALQPQIIVKMLLSDSEYDVKAVLWRHNASEFFHGVAAEDLLHNASARDRVLRCLDTLCPPNSDLEHRPLMECCLMCYLVNNTIHFQIFDTQMVM